MKRIVYLVILLTTMQSYLIAQETAPGIKGGLNYATVSGGEGSASGIIGFHLGGYYQYMISDMIAIQPELLIQQGGFNFEQNVPFFGDMSQKWRVTYLQIPVVAKFYIGGAEGLSIDAGLYLGIKITDKVTTEASNSAVTVGEPAPTKGLDFGIPIGLSYALGSGLNFGIRFNYGLAKFVDGGTSQNRIFNFTVGYSFL